MIVNEGTLLDICERVKAVLEDHGISCNKCYIYDWPLRGVIPVSEMTFNAANLLSALIEIEKIKVQNCLGNVSISETDYGIFDIELVQKGEKHER